jgi:leishmanolysin-like peptidase
LADAAGKHNFRIKVTYGTGLDQNTGNPSDIQRLTKRVLIPAATAWLEKALKVQDVKDSTIKVQRNCPSDHHLINGLRYCVGSCSSTTKCGKAIVPESHLERCHTCDDDKQTNCGATGVTNPGVTGHDLILYVTATACSNGEHLSSRK